MNKTFRKVLIIINTLILAALTLCLVACSCSDDPSGPNDKREDFLELNRGESLTLQIGQKWKISCETNLSESIVYSIEDEEIASISQEGNIEANSIGETWITAKCGDVEAECFLMVIKPNNVSLETGSVLKIINKDITFYIGGFIESDLVAVLSKNDIPVDEELTWKSENESIAVVDENGHVRGLAVGQTYVVATFEKNGEKVCARACITVQEKYTVKFEKEQYNLEKGETIQLDAKVIDANGTEIEKELNWQSPNSKIASVDNDGRVFGVEVGETIISVSLDGEKYYIKVVVE